MPRGVRAGLLLGLLALGCEVVRTDRTEGTLSLTSRRGDDRVPEFAETRPPTPDATEAHGGELVPPAPVVRIWVLPRSNSTTSRMASREKTYSRSRKGAPPRGGKDRGKRSQAPGPDAALVGAYQSDGTMQISREHNFIFVHVPGTLGGLIEDSGFFSDALAQHQIKGFWAIEEMTRNSAVRNLDGHFSAGIIRHPCMRFVESFIDLAQQQSNETIGSQSIEAYLASGMLFQPSTLTRLPFRPMSHFLFHSDGTYGVDYTLVTEDLARTRIVLRNILKSRGLRTKSRVLVANHTQRTVERLLSMYSATPNGTEGAKEICRSLPGHLRASIEQVYALDFCTFGYQRGVRGVDELPPTLVRQQYSARYKMCRRKVSSYHRPNMLGATVYTYIPTPEDHDDGRDSAGCDEQAASVATWRTVWNRAGWKPRVLTEEDARLHPRYKELKRVLRALPIKRSRQKEIRPQFLQYLAVAARGGGWLAKVDTVAIAPAPAHFSKLPHEGRFTLWEGELPSLVSGTRREYDRIIGRIIKTIRSASSRLGIGELESLTDMGILRSINSKKPGTFETENKVVGAHMDLGTGLFINDRCYFERSGYIAAHISPFSIVQIVKASSGSGEVPSGYMLHRPRIMAQAVEVWEAICQTKDSMVLFRGLTAELFLNPTWANCTASAQNGL